MRHEINPERGMSLIVKTVSRYLAGFIVLYGVCLVLYGHDTPGGGFAGGAAIASGFILLMLAFGGQTALGKLGQLPAAVVASSGVLIFLGLAMAGLFFANAFFENFIDTPELLRHGPFSAVFILLCEIAVALVVSMALFLVFSLLARARTDAGEPQHREEE